MIECTLSLIVMAMLWQQNKPKLGTEFTVLKNT